MMQLYHYPLSPYARKIRIMLKELDVEYTLLTEQFWEMRPEFLRLNPSGEVPVLADEDANVLADSNAIAEYLAETQTSRQLLGKTPLERAEVRRLVGWFDRLFYAEACGPILEEKVYKFFRDRLEPNADILRAARKRVPHHLDYLATVVSTRGWLGTDYFSYADITAAAHLSVLDYLGEVPWEPGHPAKEWYALVKSRPSFQALLQDRIPGYRPANHYMNLDF